MSDKDKFWISKKHLHNAIFSAFLEKDKERLHQEADHHIERMKVFGAVTKETEDDYEISNAMMDLMIADDAASEEMGVPLVGDECPKTGV